MSAAALGYVCSRNLPELLAGLDASLWVTTYQTGKLLVFRPVDGRISMLPRTFERAMGLAVRNDRVALASNWQVWELGRADGVDGQPTFVPRLARVTGSLDLHEMVYGDDELWCVNTAWSCLSTLSDTASFVPRWKPPFVPELSPGDACHLNGLALDHGRPRYVTAHAPSSDPTGWRNAAADSGLLIDVVADEVLVDGLVRPHSPRLHDGQLYVLDSGRGRLCRVASGELQTIADVPGFPRGLSCLGNLAFVGISRVRDHFLWPVDLRPEQTRCGIAVIDLTSGECLAELWFTGAVRELFAVEVLAGTPNPAVVGIAQDTVQQMVTVGAWQSLG